MTDPMDALVDLQKQVRKGMPMQPVGAGSNIKFILDFPKNLRRITYAKIEHGRVKSLAQFVQSEPIDGVACLSIGYAVPEIYRNQGWAKEIVETGIREMRTGLGRNGVIAFYIKAVVGRSNVASQSVARKVLSKTYTESVDSVSGEPALTYVRLVEC